MVATMPYDATFTLQMIYCQLWDWMELSCPDLELWLKSNILPLDAQLSGSLDRIARPKMILDNDSVQAWFEMAKHLDSGFCDELKDLILRRGSGIGAIPFFPKWMWVSPLLPYPMFG
jgi:hypothetical protein